MLTKPIIDLKIIIKLMEIIFQLHRYLQQLKEDKSESSQRLQKIINEIKALGLDLQPLSSPEETSSQYYRIEIEDRTLADEIVLQLQESPLVDGAYVKPSDESANP